LSSLLIKPAAEVEAKALGIVTVCSAKAVVCPNLSTVPEVTLNVPPHVGV